MVLSEAEAEAQLAALRRQREALDRTITDLTLYLELGRRLTGGSPLRVDERSPPASASLSSTPGPWPSPDLAEHTETEDRRAPPHQHASDRETAAERRASPPMQSSPSDDVRSAIGAANTPETRKTGTAGRPDEPTPMDGALSEGVLARRYGRALIEAALAALDEAGRPLHASEILAVLTNQGFSLPGHDPVAALNTRLWKRSGPGGPLKRMGDAVYARVELEDESALRRDEDEG